MLVQSAETRFQRGLEALAGGRTLEALALFEAALEVEQRLGARTPQARYLSYYGLSLARNGSRPSEGVELCRRAIAIEFFNADLFLNYGRALLATNRRKEAHKALARGLSLQQSHQDILRELSRMGRRRRPVLAFLQRENPINVALGKLLRPGAPTGSAKRAPSATA